MKKEKNKIEISEKSRTATFLLAFFLGGLGIHRFYVGKNGTGLTILLLSIFSIFTLFISGAVSAVWALIDCIIILCGGFKDNKGKIIKKW
jgi:TM2 domain-containing membrane protein YozV